MANATIGIANGAQASDTLDLWTAFAPAETRYVPVRVEFPAMSGSYVSVQVSSDNSTWLNLCYADGTTVTLGCGGSAQAVEIPNPMSLTGVRYFRLNAASAQGGARSIVVGAAQYLGI